MNSEASELPKGLVLGRDGNINIRITPLDDVGCHIVPSSFFVGILVNILRMKTNMFFKESCYSHPNVLSSYPPFYEFFNYKFVNL